MKNKKEVLKKARKILKIFLIVTLCLGIVSTSFGIVAAALGNKNTNKDKNGENPDGTNSGDTPTEETVTYEYPTKDYNYNNEVKVKDNVIMLSDEQSNKINDAIVSVEERTSYYNGKTYYLTLSSGDPSFLEGIYRNSIIHLKGNEKTTFGCDRFFKVLSLYNNNGNANMELAEPQFDEVFESMEVSTSDLLTETNFVDAYYMGDTTSHFGDADAEVAPTATTESLDSSSAQPLAYTAGNTEVTYTGNQYSTKGGDLIITLDVDLGEQDDDDEENSGFMDASCKLSGQIGIKDLAAHLVIDMPSATNIQEFYVGLSGQFFADVHLKGELSAETESESSEKDWKFLTLEGISEKHFPVAVFQFNGTTPVYITSGVYETSKQSVIPTIYFVVYSDWEGNITVGLEAGFTYSHSFNNGLRLCDNGEQCIRLEKYPFTKAYDVESEDGLVWDATVNFEANTDITLLGASVLFYVAGVNVAEVSVARVGLQAQANATFEANSKDGVKDFTSDSYSYYARLYLNMLEFKVKITAKGKKWLDQVSLDLDFHFAVVDITLLEKGTQPNSYKPVVPISSEIAPTDFTSVISLVCDVSGSMSYPVSTGETKLEASKSAAEMIVSTTEKWSEKYPDEKYGIGVVQFESIAKTVTIPHTDYDYIKSCIKTMYTTGTTNMAAGIDTAVSQLEAVTSSNKIIILMSDGYADSDSEAIASAEIARSKGIKIYTIGFGEDANEEHLKKIAEMTGGEYKFADTSSIMGIVGGFMYAQQASTSDVLAESQGTVSEGETTAPESFVVRDANGDLCITTAWPGSFLETIIIDPSGRVVDEDYPGATIDESSIPSIITISNPVPGKWSYKIKGVETSYDDEPYYTIVSFKNTKNAALNTPMTEMQNVASYCIPLGIYSTLVSSMLLVCVGKKKDDDESTPEEQPEA